MEGFKYSKSAFIITDQYEKVAKRSSLELDRGATGLYAKGMYSGDEKCMLYCVVSKKQIVELKDIVASVDPDAFVIVSDVREVLGEDFWNIIRTKDETERQEIFLWRLYTGN